MIKIEELKNFFTDVEPLDDPVVETCILQDKTTDLKMDYRVNSPDGLTYIFKFKLVTPNSNYEKIKLLHGFTFKTTDPSLIIKKDRLFSDFLTILIVGSVELCGNNKDLFPNFNVKLTEKDLTGVVRNCISFNVN